MVWKRTHASAHMRAVRPCACRARAGRLHAHKSGSAWRAGSCASKQARTMRGLHTCWSTMCVRARARAGRRARPPALLLPSPAASQQQQLCGLRGWTARAGVGIAYLHAYMHCVHNRARAGSKQARWGEAAEPGACCRPQRGVQAGLQAHVMRANEGARMRATAGARAPSHLHPASYCFQMGLNRE